MRVAICDDDRRELRKYHDLLIKTGKKYGFPMSISQYTDGEDFLFNIQDEDSCVPDAVFLDINMPKLKGVDVARKLSDMNINTSVVFLTVSEEHFLDAFDLGAFNYVVKTKEPETRLEKILSTLHEKSKEDNEDYIILTSCGERVIISLKDILYFESDNRIITVYYGDKSFEFYSTLGKLEEELMGRGFVRNHRSHILSIGAMQSYTGSSVTMVNGDVLPIGRSHYRKFKEAVEAYTKRGKRE